MGQLHFVSSIIVFSWQASKTIFSVSPFLRKITGLIKVFPLVSESVFSGATIAKCVKISSKCYTRSCNWRGMRVALCFLNTAVAFKGRFSFTLILAKNRHRIQT